MSTHSVQGVIKHKTTHTHLVTSHPWDPRWSPHLKLFSVVFCLYYNGFISLKSWELIVFRSLFCWIHIPFCLVQWIIEEQECMCHAQLLKFCNILQGFAIPQYFCVTSAVPNRSLLVYMDSILHIQQIVRLFHVADTKCKRSTYALLPQIFSKNT